MLSYILLSVPAFSTMVTSSKPNPIRPVGSDVILICTVELSSAVNILVTVNVQLSDPAGSPLTTTIPSISGSTYTSTAIVRSFGRDQSGNYICTATVSTPLLFYTNSRPQSVSTYITVGKTHCVYNNIMSASISSMIMQLLFRHVSVLERDTVC